MDWGFIPHTVALASVALMGYLFGRSALRQPKVDANQLRCELKRAKVVVDEMERIAQEVRRNLASHHGCIVQFKERVAELHGDGAEGAAAVCQEAERLLRPTLKLAAQMATAYDELRQQSCRLMSFTEVRTDVLTGLSNRRALDEAISTLLALKKRYRTEFSLAIFDIDNFKKINEDLGHVQGDTTLKDVAQRFERCVRETDIVARYGGEENEALYGAKASGRNSIFLHNGTQLEPVTSVQAIAAASEDTLVAAAAQEETLVPAASE
jgi:predicted signal transduction protein with EAL and GGDEF domain